MKVEWPYEFPGAYFLDGMESELVMSALKSRSLFRYYGLSEPEFVDKYENAARKYYRCKYSLAVNSGTGALTAAMSALDIGPGCEVIVPAFLWVATIGAIVGCNAIPVLCEVNDSFTMDPQDLKQKINSRTKLIIPIHMAGAPCNMKEIMTIATEHNIAILEDCAQCNGGEYNGRKVGTYGDIGIFSLQYNKNMTCGEGGLIITDDENLYKKSFSAHDMGLIRVNGRLSMPDKKQITWGQGRRMSELQGAAATAQLKKLDKIIGHMLTSKRRIKNMLNGISGITFRRLEDEGGDTGPFMIIIVEDEDKAKNAALKMHDAGLHNVFRVADYGLHIYYNIPALVGKVPLSSAGNPWSLSENAESIYLNFAP